MIDAQESDFPDVGRLSVPTSLLLFNVQPSHRRSRPTYLPGTRQDRRVAIFGEMVHPEPVGAPESCQNHARLAIKPILIFSACKTLYASLLAYHDDLFGTDLVFET